jgi:hypothetical protein
MSYVTLRRRIATLVVLAFVSVMGSSVAAATVADHAYAQLPGGGTTTPIS